MSEKNYTKIDHNIANALGINLSLPDSVRDTIDNEESVAEEVEGEVLSEAPEDSLMVSEDEDESVQGLSLEQVLAELQTAENIEKLDEDFDDALKRKKRLMVLAEQLFLDSSQMAIDLESSRGVEVASNLLKILFEENEKLEIHQKHAWIRSELDGVTEEESAGPMNATQNNIEQAIFVGSTADLNAQLAEMKKAKEEENVSE